MRLVAATLALSVAATGCSVAMTGQAGDDGGVSPRGDAGASDGPGAEPACQQTVAIDVAVVAYPPDLMLVVDRSSSMGLPTEPLGFTMKWDLMTGALRSLVDQFRGRVDFGLMLSPHDVGACNAAEVDVAPAAGTTAAIDGVLTTAQPGGGTPTSGSLANALADFAGRAVNPNGRYVLLATDGVPNCVLDPVNETLVQIRALRAAGIETFVIGYAAPADAVTLDQFAAAGGTGAYYPVAADGDLAAAFDDITGSVTEVACSYVLADGRQPHGVALGSATVPRALDHGDGWDYDAASTTLTLYGAACDGLRTTPASALRVTYCSTPE